VPSGFGRTGSARADGRHVPRCLKAAARYQLLPEVDIAPLDWREVLDMLAGTDTHRCVLAACATPVMAKSKGRVRTWRVDCRNPAVVPELTIHGSNARQPSGRGFGAVRCVQKPGALRQCC
jgi:hypothetical protein